MKPFERAISFVLEHEGGLVDHPSDPGGITKFGISKRCLDPSTRVLTADLKWIECGRLAVGDQLLAFDEVPERHGKLNLRRIRRSRVDAIGTVTLPASRITTSERTVIASDEHMWLARRGAHRVYQWIGTKYLLKPIGKFGHRKTVVRIAKFISPWNVESTRDAGYIAGILDGEGHTHNGYIGFSQKENSCLLQAERCLHNLGLSFKRHNYRRGVWAVQIFKRDSPFFAVELSGRLGADRLLGKLANSVIGQSIASKRSSPEQVLSVDSMGERSLVAISTSSQTLIAEGLLSHNSYPDLDIANLTVTEATLIYERDYWTLCQCDKLPSPLAVVLFDSAVNQGPSAAIRSLQESLGVKVDGVIGPVTIAAATRCDIKKTLPLLVAERAVRYSKNPNIATFGRGWFRRLAACHQAALEPL